MNRAELCLSLAGLAKINGQPADKMITPGQLDIFRAVVLREYTRYQFTTSTQYGKSQTVGIACLPTTCIQGKRVVVVAPNEEKAKIIMRYYIDHMGDNELFYSQLERSTKLERLRQEESKERITLRNGGGIFVISANTSNSLKSVESAMGEGAEIVILDEAALVPDMTEATIFRMIAGKGPKATYIKIGNPFYRNHFYQSFINPNYKNIVIDYKQAIAEGRYDEAFIEEARTKPLFDILYECKFPEHDAMDEAGWPRIFKDDLIKLVTTPFGEHKGRKRLGVDIGAGGDPSAFVLRSEEFAEVLETNREANTMIQVGKIIDYCHRYCIEPSDVFVDDTGVGTGVSDKLAESGLVVNQCHESASPMDELRYHNAKAESFWAILAWLNNSGKLKESNGWSELLEIRSRPKESNGRLIIESKESLRKRGVRSPNIADALALTFYPKQVTTGDDLFFT